MFYMLKVYALVTLTVFGFSAAILMTMMAFREANTRARQAMHRIATAVSRDQLVISRIYSQFHGGR